MELNQLVMSLENIRKALGGDYAPQQLSILLLVYLRPGISHKEIGQELSMKQVSVSRNCKRLGRYIIEGRDGVTRSKGYGLVNSRKDENFNKRQCIVHLTQKGRQFVSRIQDLIELRPKAIPPIADKRSE